MYIFCTFFYSYFLEVAGVCYKSANQMKYFAYILVMGSTVLHIQKYPNYPSFNPFFGGGIFITARLHTGISLIKTYTHKKKKKKEYKPNKKKPA